MKDFCLLNDCYFSIVFCLIFKLPATYFWAFLIMSFLNLKSFQKNSYSTAVSWHFCLSTCLQSPSIMEDFCLLNDCYFSVIFCLISSFLQLTYFWTFLIMSFLNLKSFQKNAHSNAVSWHSCLSTRLQSPSTMEDFCLLNDCYFSVTFYSISKISTTYLLLNFLKRTLYLLIIELVACLLTFLPVNLLTVTLNLWKISAY